MSQEKRILVFGDVHAPFQHKDALEFLLETYEAYDCNQVVCVGDLMDFHRSSRHTAEIDSMSADEEYILAKSFIADLMEIFPDGIHIMGNHDSIPYRQAKEVNVSISTMKNPRKLLNLGNGWNVKPLYHVEKWKGYKHDVLFEHGLGAGGMNGSINMALAKRCSYTNGHHHANAGVSFRTNHESTVFGLNTGCLCDDSALAMRYGKHNKFKGVLGCGVVFSPEMAIFEKM